MKEELRVIIVKESLWQSIVADIITVGFLLVGLYLNHNYLGDSAIVTLFLVASLLLQALTNSGDKVKKMTPKQALAYLSERESL